MPMATQFSTSLILTTTTAGSENHFSQMSRIKDPDTGKPLFTTIRLGKPCDACLKAKGEFWTCDHKKSETPDWISGDKKKRFIIYYEGMNRVGDMQRELYSVETTNGERMYGDDEIAALKAATLYSSVLRPKLMFVGIDPNGGGESGYGVVSGFFDKGTLVITSLDSKPIATNLYKDKEAYLHSVFEPILAHKNFGKAFVIAPEVEPGGNTSEAECMFNSYNNILVLNEAGTERRPGIIKTNKLTYQMKAKFRQLLRDKKVRFHEKLVTTTFENEDMAKDELYKQMEHFVSRIEKGREVVNGKQHGQDDLLTALHHLITGADCFLVTRSGDQRYELFKDIHRLRKSNQLLYN